MISRLSIKLIRLYQILTSNNPPSCRFIPSCSHYAISAIEKHGWWNGLRLTLLRLFKCHPFHPGGYDPVP